MSKKGKWFSITLLALAEIFIFVVCGAAQDIKVTIRIDPAASSAKVSGVMVSENKSRNWGFLRSIAGVDNLGERISEFDLRDAGGKAVAHRKLMAGEYLADAAAQNFSYEVNLKAPEKLSALAHVSWIKDDSGVLMLADLLPQFGNKTSAEVVFEMPENWKIGGEAKNTIKVEEIEKAVFLIGSGFREREAAVGKNKISFVFSGEFLFAETDAVQFATEIFREYEKIFGATPGGEAIKVFLIRLPREAKSGNWEAETRGSNVTILSSDMPFKSQSVQRLHEQFRHELFHLWMPNDLALSGNYDWFYEGFALYQSLRTGVAVNRIRFEDYLDTLGRASDLDNLQQIRKTSLIEASKNRWTGAGNAQVYARGMLTAFLADITLLRESRGKRSLTDVLRAVYQNHRKPAPMQDGNEAVIRILESHAELRPLVARYIRGAEKLDWQTDLAAIGIETNGENFPVKLSVKAKLSGRQKDLLDELGYNNWRKLSPK